MRKILGFLFCLIVFTSNIEAKKLTAYYSTGSYYSPKNGAYVETYLSVKGSSVNFVKNAKGKYQGSIEVSVAFMQDTLVKNFQKYNLLSPEIDDTLHEIPNFIDQQRYTLLNGTYEVELTIADKTSKSKPYKTVQQLTVSLNPTICGFSSIELLESMKPTEKENIFSKSGYDLIPFVSSYYPQFVTALDFYTELYNSDKQLGKGEKFMFTYYIESYESKVMLSSFYNYSKQTAEKVNILLSSFSIKDLPSGNYNLVVEAHNKSNETIAVQRQFFQRNNPSVGFDINDMAAITTTGMFIEKYTNKDSLVEYIRSTRPIASTLEKNFIDNQAKIVDLQTLQKFFYGFWIKRDEKMPEKKWLDYNEQVKIANKEFGSGRIKGYLTDRGRVFLQYGPPNYRNPYLNEPNAYPYEIWEYLKLNSQNNRKFVFYNADLVSNNFKLLHSDVIGEKYDNRWQMVLTKRVEQGPDLDKEKATPGYGSQMDDNFNNPR